MKTEKKELAKQAKNKGICLEWYKALKNAQSINELANMYLNGIDFCTENDYPSIDFIRANFKGKIEEFGIHLDETVTLTNPKKTVLLGECEGTIKLDGFSTIEVFLKHNSSIEILASGNSFIMVDVFDNSTLSVKATENAKVRIRQHGGQVSFTTAGCGTVKILPEMKVESIQDSNQALFTNDLTDK